MLRNFQYGDQNTGVCLCVCFCVCVWREKDKQRQRQRDREYLNSSERFFKISLIFKFNNTPKWENVQEIMKTVVSTAINKH